MASVLPFKTVQGERGAGLEPRMVSMVTSKRTLTRPPPTSLQQPQDDKHGSPASFLSYRHLPCSRTTLSQDTELSPSSKVGVLRSKAQPTKLQKGRRLVKPASQRVQRSKEEVQESRSQEFAHRFLAIINRKVEVLKYMLVQKKWLDVANQLLSAGVEAEAEVNSLQLSV